MSVRVRLTRVGSKKNPIWRVVVADQRSPRDGRFIETIGQYNPQTEPSTIVIDRERFDHWIARGAQPTNTVTQLIRAQAKAPPVVAEPVVAEAPAAPAEETVATEAEAPEAAAAAEAEVAEAPEAAAAEAPEADAAAEASDEPAAEAEAAAPEADEPSADADAAAEPQPEDDSAA